MFARALEHQYVFSMAKWCKQDDDTARMYADAVVRYSKKYNLNSKLIARQIFRESYYNYKLRHPRSGAAGCCQITPMIEFDRLYKQTENYNDLVPVRQQYYYIYPSIEVMCMLMSNYNAKYKSYNIALIAYWAGPSSKEINYYFKNKFDFTETEYYKYIMVEGYIEHYIMGF